MTKAIVTKTGNSYALRVPKQYIDDHNLKLGDTVEIAEPLTRQQQALTALVRHGQKQGPLKNLADPVAWQRQLRHSSNPWEEVKRDTTG